VEEIKPTPEENAARELARQNMIANLEARLATDTFTVTFNGGGQAHPTALGIVDVKMMTHAELAGLIALLKDLRS